MVKVFWVVISMNEEGQTPRRAFLSLVPKPPKRKSTIVVGRMISQKLVKNNVVFTVLKATWGSYGSVKMSELEEGVMSFDFENDVDRDRVLDMSHWAIHGHCLNLKLWLQNQSLDEAEFRKIQMWVQVHGLSGEMLNSDNASEIADRIGKGLTIEKEKEMQVR